MIDHNNRFYCSQKFWWLSVDLDKSQLQSCCSASPQKVNFEWLKDNQGQLFNTPDLLAERAAMLNDLPVASCNNTCWAAEAQNIPSRRLVMGSNQVTHTELRSDPEILNIMVGKDCNMTCSYCCKHYSTGWIREIQKHGDYAVDAQDDRLSLNDRDRVRLYVSQQELDTPRRRTLIKEIGKLVHSGKLRGIMISGGEPFLYNDLADLLSQMPFAVPTTVWTGLGVNPKRLQRELDTVVLYQNISLVVSAENINSAYEFNRAGNSWENFVTNIEAIERQRVSYTFNSVISNLTVFGLEDFVTWAGQIPMAFSACTDPDYLGVHVMDAESKQRVLERVDNLPAEAKNIIVNSIMIEPTPQQISNCRNYVTEFARRRQLSLDIFPQSFVKWINDVV
jgi:molybdenum cofactor biosynthesis enzyme MoaA